MTYSLDDKVLAKEHALCLLKALREIASAVERHQNSVGMSTRAREATLAGVVLRAREATALLTNLGLK